ncbi:MAG: helix-turn-helix domain-containing protein [Pseudonocardiales bacterium]
MAKRPKTGSRPDVEVVRLRMQSLGAPVDVIAAEISRRYEYRPRQAYRLAHGWNQSEAAERYNQLVQARGTEHAGRDTMSPSRVSEYERWPDATRKPSVYALATFAELYGTTIGHLIDAADLDQLSATDRTTVLGPASGLDTARSSTVVVMDNGADPATIQRRRRRATATEPDTAFSTAEEYLMEIADQSQEAAALAEATNIGDTSLTALHRSVEDIGQLYRRTAPLPMFRRAVSLRNRILDLLEGRQHVNQTRELYAAASKVCALLGWMSGDFEQHSAALAQGDAAWVFAEQADQNAVRALARIAQAKAAHWADQFDKSASYAHDGLRYASGANAVLLACLEASSAADLGDADRAAGALRRAEDERTKSGPTETGELFFCGEIERYNYTANVRYVIGDHVGSLEAAESAITAAESMPVAERRYNSVAFAHTNTAVASIATGDLDRAITGIGTVLTLPSSHRLATLSQRLDRTQRLLTAPAWQGSKPARELYAQISDFRRDTASRGLIS